MIVYELGIPIHPAKVGVTVIVAVMAVAPVFVAVNEEMLPVPFAAIPIAVLVFVQANVAPTDY